MIWFAVLYMTRLCITCINDCLHLYFQVCAYQQNLSTGKNNKVCNKTRALLCQVGGAFSLNIVLYCKYMKYVDLSLLPVD